MSVANVSAVPAAADTKTAGVADTKAAVVLESSSKDDAPAAPDTKADSQSAAATNDSVPAKSKPGTWGAYMERLTALVQQQCTELNIAYDELDFSRYAPGKRGRLIFADGTTDTKECRRYVPVQKEVRSKTGVAIVKSRKWVIGSSVMVECPCMFVCRGCRKQWPSGKGECRLEIRNECGDSKAKPVVAHLYTQYCRKCNDTDVAAFPDFFEDKWLVRIQFVLKIASNQEVEIRHKEQLVITAEHDINTVRFARRIL